MLIPCILADKYAFRCAFEFLRAKYNTTSYSLHLHVLFAPRPRLLSLEKGKKNEPRPPPARATRSASKKCNIRRISRLHIRQLIRPQLPTKLINFRESQRPSDPNKIGPATHKIGQKASTAASLKCSTQHVWR